MQRKQRSPGAGIDGSHEVRGQDALAPDVGGSRRDSGWKRRFWKGVNEWESIMYRVVFFSVPFAIAMLASPGLAFESALFPGEGPIRIRASGDDMVLRKAPIVNDRPTAAKWGIVLITPVEDRSRW